ncbi:MAG: putative flavoprotein involved in transport [Pseudonocardiales bacterium]|nr:putative flavoprotein involved in transport [Pseudonocardiales bacterium]
MSSQGESEGAGCPPEAERFETVVIGGGQTGLTVGYYLAQFGQPFVIVDAGERIGDSWRQRWDSLRLFTPARYDGLPGWPFPASVWSFPTRDEMADYLQAYAARFDFPIRSGFRVDRLSRARNRYILASQDRRIEADNVVVAMSSYQRPTVPEFAMALDASILQLHSDQYRNPAQLRDGGVLVVGGGNSGADIALEVAGRHPTWLSGRSVGHIPVRLESVAARLLLVRLTLRVVFHRVLTVNNFIGRRIQSRVLSRGGPLIRVKPRDIFAAGIERVPRVVGVSEGLPLLADQRVLTVSNVVWCTGFRPDFSWIDLPGFGPQEPWRHSGAIPSQPGLYFVGLLFLYAMSSSMIHGVGRDAERVARLVVRRNASARSMHGRSHL